MEVFDPHLPYLHEETTPRPIVDIMRPAALLSARMNLGAEATKWFLDTTKCDLAEAINAVDPSNTREVQSGDDENGEWADPPYDVSTIMAPVVRLSSLLELDESRAERFVRDFQVAVDANLTASFNGSYAEVRDRGRDDSETAYGRLGHMIADEVGLEDAVRSALIRTLNPGGQSLVSDAEDEAVTTFAMYIARKFPDMDDRRMELTAGQRMLLRQFMGDWYIKVTSDSARRAPRSLTNMIGLRTGKHAEKVTADLYEALTYVVTAPGLQPESRPLPKERIETEKPVRKPIRTARTREPARRSRPVDVKKDAVPVKTAPVREPRPIPLKRPVPVTDERPAVSKQSEPSIPVAITEPPADSVVIRRPEFFAADREHELTGHIEAGLIAEKRLIDEAGTLSDADIRDLRALVRKGRRSEDRLEKAG